MAKVQYNLLKDIQLRKWVRAGVPVAKSDGAGLTSHSQQPVLQLGFCATNTEVVGKR